jgi:amidase
VGVAAGFSPLSLGTETSGFLTTPGNRAALYAMKLTPASVSMEGVWQVAALFDTAGGTAESVRDLAVLSDVLLQQMDPARPSLVDAMREDWEGLSVGFVDIELWRLPAEVRGGYNEHTVSITHIFLRVEYMSTTRLLTANRLVTTRTR